MELKRVSHNYLSKSNSEFLPFILKNQMGNLTCILGTSLIKTHNYYFGDLLPQT